jgi:hypothetical protein
MGIGFSPVVDLDVRHIQVEVLDDGLAPDRDEKRLCLQGISSSFASLACRRVLAAVGAALALRLLLLAGLGARDLYLHAGVGLLQALGVGLG